MIIGHFEFFFIFTIVFPLELETRLYYHYDWYFIYTDGLQQDTKMNFVVNENL